MNLCTFVGRLTKNPELKYSKDKQIPIAKFTLAVDRAVKQDGEATTDFFTCVAFDRRAEFVKKYLVCGMRVAVYGKMRNENYTNKDGEKVYGVSLFMDNIEFADGKRENQEPQAQASAAPAAQPAAQGNRVDQTAGTPARGSNSAVTRTAASQPAVQTPPASKPAVSQSAAPKPAAKPASQRTPTGRTAPARPTGQRSAVSRSAGGFMNVPNGGLPFN